PSSCSQVPASAVRSRSASSSWCPPCSKLRASATVRILAHAACQRRHSCRSWQYARHMHVAITGASSGIGAALARELGRAGHTLTLVARRRALLDGLAAEIGARAHAIEHDLADPSRATGWISGAVAAHGEIDVLVNNAGMENTGPTVAADPEVCRRM